MEKIIRIFIILVVVSFSSCEKETEFTNNPPSIDLLTSSLSGAVGDTISIKAYLKDDYVLKYAKLICPALALDETIMITIKNKPTNASHDVIKSEDNFNYDFVIPSVAVSGNNYQIELRVKNITSQTTSVYITLNVD